MHNANFHFKGYGNFIARRIIRIEPPYLISIVLCLILGWLSTISPYYHGPGFHISVPALASHIGYLTALLGFEWMSPVYWTLAIEFQYYLIIGLLLFFLCLTKKKYIIYLTILLMFLLCYLFPDNRLVFHYFPLFIVGIITFQLKSKLINYIDFIFLSIASFSMIAYIFPFESFVAVAFAYVFINWINFETAISEFLGKISFSVYLIHVPIGSRIINISQNFVHNEIGKTIMVLVALAISIFCAWLFNKFIEMPFLYLSKKIKYL